MHLRSARTLGTAILLSAPLVACGSDSSSPLAPSDAAIDLGAPSPYVDGGTDASWHTEDGGFSLPDGGTLRADRFITKVISFTQGECGGFGASAMPDVLLGPPVGGGENTGSLDVVSLGTGGEIVVSFEPNAIVDGPGVDLLVFENAFMHGNASSAFTEPGEVSVSEDGVDWKTFPCPATSVSGPYGSCAGIHPVYADPTNGISPLDPNVAGGDPYDLADVGLTRAPYVRIRDRSFEACVGGNTNGFDLDAMGIVNAETP
jgi:hypothetical protein